METKTINTEKITLTYYLVSCIEQGLYYQGHSELGDTDEGEDEHIDALTPHIHRAKRYDSKEAAQVAKEEMLTPVDSYYILADKVQYKVGQLCDLGSDGEAELIKIDTERKVGLFSGNVGWENLVRATPIPAKRLMAKAIDSYLDFLDYIDYFTNEAPSHLDVNIEKRDFDELMWINQTQPTNFKNTYFKDAAIVHKLIKNNLVIIAPRNPYPSYIVTPFGMNVIVQCMVRWFMPAQKHLLVNHIDRNKQSLPLKTRLIQGIEPKLRGIGKMFHDIPFNQQPLFDEAASQLNYLPDAEEIISSDREAIIPCVLEQGMRFIIESSTFYPNFVPVDLVDKLSNGDIIEIQKEGVQIVYSPSKSNDVEAVVFVKSKGNYFKWNEGKWTAFVLNVAKGNYIQETTLNPTIQGKDSLPFGQDPEIFTEQSEENTDIEY